MASEGVFEKKIRCSVIYENVRPGCKIVKSGNGHSVCGSCSLNETTAAPCAELLFLRLKRTLRASEQKSQWQKGLSRMKGSGKSSRQTRIGYSALSSCQLNK